jgi:hypothetical protein
MIRNSQNNTERTFLITRSKLCLNTNCVLIITPNASHIYEFSPRKTFRCVRISFGIPKLKYRNSATKARLNVTAADLKKLKIRKIYKEIKSRSVTK